MRRIAIAIVTVAMAGGFMGLGAASASESPRSGALHVTKVCLDYHGNPDEYCTITSSNIEAIQVGSKVFYATPPSANGTLDSDIVVTHGRGSQLYGHVTLNAATMLITFAGGTGQFRHFSGRADVTVTDPGTPSELWYWDGQYTFGSSRQGSTDD
jgi:hypothetical protein